MKKYELTNEVKTYYGRALHRIKALKNFGCVRAGDLGGWIESESNLSQRGCCWVDADCVVGGNVCVSDAAQVHNSFIIGNESNYIKICGWSDITRCEFDPLDGNILICDSIVTQCGLAGKCVVTRSTIINKSCIAERIISDSVIADLSA